MATEIGFHPIPSHVHEMATETDIRTPATAEWQFSITAPAQRQRNAGNQALSWMLVMG